MQNGSKEKRHPIQVAVRRTGLSADVLRVWEKRYGVVRPGRSPAGHRLYSDSDLERLLLLNQVTSAGRRISRIAALDTDALQELAKEDAEAAFAAREAYATPASGESHLADSLAAVERSDPRALERELTRASLVLPADVFIGEVVGPLLDLIGERWEHGRLTVGKEHLATPVIREVLASLIGAFEPERDAPTLLVTTPVGQQHELGALMVAAAAVGHGWCVVYLGANLPAREVADVARSAGARVIALSVVFPSDDPALPAELRTLREEVGADTEILVGGRAAQDYAEAIEAIDARLIDGLPGLVGFLTEDARRTRPATGRR